MFLRVRSGVLIEVSAVSRVEYHSDYVSGWGDTKGWFPRVYLVDGSSHLLSAFETKDEAIAAAERFVRGDFSDVSTN